MPVPIGRMRHRVTVEAPTPGRNGFNEVVPAWSAEATVWADVRPLSGRELWQAQQVQAETTHKVTIRYRTGVTQEKRLNHRGRVLNIEAVINVDEKNEVLELLCKES